MASAGLAGQILALAPNQTLRDVIAGHNAAGVQLVADDPTGMQDIDLPEDYAALAHGWM